VSGRYGWAWPLGWTANLAARLLARVAGEAKVPVQPLVLLAQQWQRQAAEDTAAPAGTPGWACGHAMADTRRGCADQLLTAMVAALRGDPVNPPATVAGRNDGSST